MGAILPAFFVLWEFSEFLPVKPSTNGVYYYLRDRPRGNPTVRRVDPGKVCSNSLPQAFVLGVCGCLCPVLGLSFPVCSMRRRAFPGTGKVRVGKHTGPPLPQLWGSESEGMPPSPCRLPETAESKEVGQADFRWKRGLLLLYVLRGQQVKVLEGQRQGFARGWRGLSRRHLGSAQEHLSPPCCVPLWLSCS